MNEYAEVELFYGDNNTDYNGAYSMHPEIDILAILYMSYMPICCLIGLTGNGMVWILIT